MLGVGNKEATAVVSTVNIKGFPVTAPPAHTVANKSFHNYLAPLGV